MPFLYEQNNDIACLDLVIDAGIVLKERNFVFKNLVITAVTTDYLTDTTNTSLINNTGFINDEFNMLTNANTTPINNIPKLVSQIIDTGDTDGIKAVIVAMEQNLQPILTEYNLILDSISYSIKELQITFSINIVMPNAKYVETVNIPYYLSQ